MRSLLSNYGQLLVLIDDAHESEFSEVNKLLLALPPDATRLLTTRSRNAGLALRCRVYPLLRLSDGDARELVLGRLRDWTGEPTAPDSSAQEETIQRLIDLVQGHALALELTAARCTSPGDLPDVVEELARTLAEGVDDVAANLLNDPTKNDSLAVCLNISLEQLAKYDRKKKTNWAERFAALGVFPDSGRMNRELIAAVWGDAGGR